jgi:hypothetical protein
LPLGNTSKTRAGHAPGNDARITIFPYARGASEIAPPGGSALTVGVAPVINVVESFHLLGVRSLSEGRSTKDLNRMFCSGDFDVVEHFSCGSLDMERLSKAWLNKGKPIIPGEGREGDLIDLFSYAAGDVL